MIGNLYGDIVQKKFMEMIGGEGDHRKRLVSLATELKHQAIKKRQEEWDDQADKGWRIRNNELPLSLNRKNFEKWKDKYFKDNWIFKAIQLKVSYLLGGNVDFNVVKAKSVQTGVYEDSIIANVLEDEVRQAHRHNNALLEDIEVLYDFFYTGYGVSRTWFNSRKRDRYWLSGTVVHEHIDSRNVYYLSRDGLCRDVYAIFYKSSAPTDELKAKYPGVADKLSETQQTGMTRSIHNEDHTEIWTCIIRKEIPLYKRELRDTINNESYLYTTIEIEEYKKHLIKQFNQEEPADDNFYVIYSLYKERTNTADHDDPERFAQYVISEEFLLDNLKLSKEQFVDEDECWFEINITSDGILLPQKADNTKQEETTYLKYIGENSGFTFIGNIKRNGSQYPFGSAWFSADMLEIKTLLMSSLAMMVMKYNKPQPVYEKGSLENETEWLSGWWRNDIAAVVDPEWRQNNPRQNPFDYVSINYDKHTYITLDQLATESIKNQEGAVDSLRGVQQYSGQSGIQTAQLQSTATTYHKTDEMKVYNYMSDIGERYLGLISTYRSFPHNIMTYTPEGDKTIVETNVSPDTTYISSEYNVIPVIEPSPELKKESNKQLAEMLYSKGLMHPLDYMHMLDVDDAEKIYQNSQVYAQLMQIQLLLEQNPQLAQQLMQQAQQPQQQNQQQPNGQMNSPDRIRQNEQKAQNMMKQV